MHKKLFVCLSISLLIAAVGSGTAQALKPIEQLGKSIFFDKTLSINENQSCAACHGPEAGWTGPLSNINELGSVYEGSIPDRFGNRKPPSAAYATTSPIFHLEKKGLFVGGNFWDGRATGEKLGNPAADQAQGPFLNPLEQALNQPDDVVLKVVVASYPVTYTEVFGPYSGDVNEAYDNIAKAIAAYEASGQVNAFTSKFDYARKGKAKLTPQEVRGFALFQGKGKCAKCHLSKGPQALFTDYTFDNLGVPKNPENPFYNEPDFNPLGSAWIDLGLGGFLEKRPDYASFASENMGKQKVPTLRNVDKRPYSGFIKAYAHNGYFKSLEEIVHFYNTRDVPGAGWNGQPWPPAEVSDTVNTTELGDLGLKPEEEADIVAFLKTLSDGYKPKSK
jgi:cytochrome c peroxidase